MDEIANGMKTMMDALSSMGSRIADMEKDGGRALPPPSYTPPLPTGPEVGQIQAPKGTCFICFGTHNVRQCPKLPKDMKEALQKAKEGVSDS